MTDQVKYALVVIAAALILAGFMSALVGAIIYNSVALAVLAFALGGIIVMAVKKG